jgi:hypothetical protein
MNDSPIQRAARSIGARLDALEIEYASAGALSLAAHGLVRATEDVDVKIDFLIEGDFPGDRAPKPVRFPNPIEAGVTSGALRVLSLPRLVELKLASGMTAPHRLQDLADVQRLIQARGLPRELANELDPYVRAKFDELWLTAQHEPDDY